MSLPLEALQGTLNFRDVGGAPLQGGGSIRHGVLYRADALATLTPEGLDALAASGIGTVFDLRTDSECRRAPDLLPDGVAIDLVHLPILGGSMEAQARQLMPADGSAPTLSPEAVAALVAQVPTLAELYVGILQDAAPQFARIARTIAHPVDAERGGVLVHCTAGKDRTGLSAALMLAAAGATREAIVADYVLTGPNLIGLFTDTMMRMFAAIGLPDVPALRELATESPAEAIAAALEWVDATHGDAAGYLRAGGLSDVELGALRDRMREQA